MVIGFDAQATPHERFGGEALLDTGRQSKILFDFLLARFELLVGFGQLRLSAFLFGDIGEGDNAKLTAVGIFESARADDDREARAVLFGNGEFVAGVAIAEALVDLALDKGPFFRSVEVLGIKADQLFRGHVRHAGEAGIDEYNALAIIGNEHTLIKSLEHLLHLLDPIRTLEIRLPFDRTFRGFLPQKRYLTQSRCNI